MSIGRRTARRELSPAQRRQQIISILSSALASMPLATAVPAKQANEPVRHRLSEKPLAGLEVSGASLKKHLPAAARHLDISIRRGRHFCYDPDPVPPWDLSG